MNYKPTIGIEVHVELKTKDKVFSYALNNTTALPNTLVNIVDLAYPGVLPQVNKEVVLFAIKIANALHANITREMLFDRKNYFYPDLPKGYQITQSKTPIGTAGFLNITSDKKVRIHELHIEEDTCKSLHTETETLLNYNRAGVPLIEIVSEPDMNSKEEAMAYLEKLKELLFYLGVSDCKMEEGSMRADVNVSVSKDATLGTRCEIKNIGSIKEVGQAIDYEVKRQIELLENGEKIEEETRKFDEKTATTVLMRKKEVGNDYRYFPEPDIPALVITDSLISEALKDEVMLPDERRAFYIQKGILPINADKLINNKELSDYLNTFMEDDIDFRIASNLLLGDIAAYLNKNLVSINDLKLTKEKMIKLVKMLSNKEISSKNVKDILTDILETDLSVKEILAKSGISMNNNVDELVSIIKEVIALNMESVKAYKSGKENAFKFLMGMCMKMTKGSFNPKLVSDTLKDYLDTKISD